MKIQPTGTPVFLLFYSQHANPESWNVSRVYENEADAIEAAETARKNDTVYECSFHVQRWAVWR